MVPTGPLAGRERRSLSSVDVSVLTVAGLHRKVGILMPYSIQPGDIIEVRLNMTMNGQRLLNVCHYRNGPDEVPDTSAAMQLELANMFDGSMGTVAGAYITALSDKLTLDYADMQVIYVGRRAYERFTIGDPCSNTEPDLPQNVQASVTKRSSFPGPSGHGRIEIPGLCENHVAGGFLSEEGKSAAAVIGVSVLAVATIALLSILAARIARTAWLMLKRKEAFDAQQFLRHKRAVGDAHAGA